MNFSAPLLAWLGGQEILVIVLVLLVVILLFGAKRLPELAKGIGQSIKEFKKGVKEGEGEPKTTSKTDEIKKPNGQ